MTIPPFRQMSPEGLALWRDVVPGLVDRDGLEVVKARARLLRALLEYAASVSRRVRRGERVGDDERHELRLWFAEFDLAPPAYLSGAKDVAA